MASASSPGSGAVDAGRDRVPRSVLLAALAAGLAVAVAEHLLRGHDYWDYSEGVYLYTSRLFLQGHDLYGSVVAAQPPPLFLVGAALLGVHDSFEWVRAGIGAVQVVTSVLAAAVVWRIAGNRVAAVAAAPLTLLTPWVVHEHGSLIPEMLAAPLLLGGVLLARDPRRAPWLGAVAALLALVKLPYLVPAVAMIAVSADRRRAARWAAAALVVGVALSTLVFGTAVWRDTVAAQVQSGRIPVRSLAGVLAQIAWHLVGLVAAGFVAWRYRDRARDRATLIAAVAVALATLATLFSVWKRGTSLNTLVAPEVMLVVVAVAGCALAFEGRRRGAAALAAAGIAFAVVQGVSLIAVHSVREGHPFLRPGSAPSYGITLSAAELDAAVAVARRCPPGVPYSSIPMIAFIADRSLPGDQADRYLVDHASVLKSARAAIAADRARCPAHGPVTH